MTPIKQPGEQPDSDILSGQPLPAPAIGETTLNNLPILTEVVAESDANPPSVLSDEEMQQLLQKLETRIEILFTQKLGLYLEQLQRQAIDHALDELKAELPELLQEALDKYLESR